MLFNKNFWKWFGESKVLTKNGLPLVVYHGSYVIEHWQFYQGSFNSFRTDHEMGAHFGDLKQAENIAPKGFSNKKLCVYPVFLSIKNPLRLIDQLDFAPSSVIWQLEDLKLITKKESLNTLHLNYSDRTQYLQKLLFRKGYDGIVYLNRFEGLSIPTGICKLYIGASDKQFKKFFPIANDSWIAFFPWQIKSIFNSGAWSKETGYILNPKR